MNFATALEEKIVLFIASAKIPDPVGTLTSNGRLLNVHIGPVDAQNGRSMNV